MSDENQIAAWDVPMYRYGKEGITDLVLSAMGRCGRRYDDLRIPKTEFLGIIQGILAHVMIVNSCSQITIDGKKYVDAEMLKDLDGKLGQLCDLLRDRREEIFERS